MSVLQSCEILDTGFAESFDRLTRLACTMLSMPIAAISLVDARRQWFKSVIGLKARQTPRDVAFCAHAILGDDVLVVEDATRDDRFADNPLVVGEPGIRFYAGAPLLAREGLPLGTLCVIDRQPRRLGEGEKHILKDLALMAAEELELHRDLARLQHRKQQLEQSEFSLRGAVRRLESLASTDPLTGIANRRAFDVNLAREMRRGARRRTPVSLLMFDLDHFKGFNDRFGHPAGDRCLAAVAGVLHEAQRRPSDLAARFGGEEFVLLLPETGADGAWQVADALRRRIASLAIEHPASAHGVVTASVGIATAVPAVGESPTGLVRAVDGALYAAKSRGRNCCVAAGQCDFAAVA